MTPRAASSCIRTMRRAIWQWGARTAYRAAVYAAWRTELIARIDRDLEHARAWDREVAHGPR